MSAQINKKKKHCKPTHLNEKRLKAYGLQQVSARDVTSVECRFCQGRAFGKEVREEVYMKRAPTSKIKMYTKPWRQDHMKRHMLEQQRERSKEYLSLSVLQKASHFDPSTAGARKEDLPKGHFFLLPTTNDEQLKIWLEKGKVEGIFGILLFDPDDDEEISTKDWFLLVFKLEDNDEALDDNPHEEEENAGLEQYLATVSKVMQDMKEILRLATLGSMSPQKVSSNVRIACAANLQTISSILKDSWAFSIKLDGGNKSDSSCLDVRLRVVSNHGMLLNLHLLAIPMRERHTAEHMFELVSTAQDNLSPEWRSQIVSVTTNSTSSMDGQYRGVASLIAKVALPGFYLVWCALYQLDLIVQWLYNSLCNDLYVGMVTSLTGHLRRQFNLINEMGSKCPQFVSTQWMSMSKVVKWFVANRFQITTHLATRNVTWMPTDQRWIVTCCLNRPCDEDC